MISRKKLAWLWSVLAVAFSLAACDIFNESLERRVVEVSKCASHVDCAGDPLRACVGPERRCVPVASEDCTLGGGTLERSDAVLLGSLFARRGAQRSTNLLREQSALLAVEEINSRGGIPLGGTKRPIALVTCDTTANAPRAARHLFETLRVPAAVWPNSSDDIADVTTEVSRPDRPVLLSPTPLTTGVDDFGDGLTFTMAPSNEQLTPLIAQQLAHLESKLGKQRELPLRLSIVYRDDELGQGTRPGLLGSTFNGKTISASLGREVQLASYDPARGQHALLVAALSEFGPDVVVLAGTAGSVTRIMELLDRAPSSRPKPHYVLLDSGRAPELLALVRDDDPLRQRVVGTGHVSDAASAPVFAAFRAAFERRFPGQWAPVAGAGLSYDAVYALAFGIALGGEPIRGRTIADGLRRLGSGHELPVGLADSAQAFEQLALSRSIRPIGTLAPLAWDARGAVRAGTVETWCITRTQSGPMYESGGLIYSVDTGTLSGEARDCADVPTGEPHASDGELAGGTARPSTDVLDAAAEADSSVGPSRSESDGGSVPEDSSGEEAHDADVYLPPDPCSDAGGVLPPAVEGLGVVAQVQNMNGDPKDAVLMPSLRVSNVGSETIPLSSLRVRYYFRDEHAALCPEACQIDSLWSGIHPLGLLVPVRRRYVEVACGAAYLEMSFPPGPARLGAGQTVELQQAFHTRSYQETFDETNDYSFTPSARQYQTTTRITVYLADALVWGAPPY